MDVTHRLLLRRIYRDYQTEGRYYAFNDRGGCVYDCDGLELPWRGNAVNISCIPEGMYPVQKHYSPKFGHCLWVREVKARSEILVHPANFVGSNNPRTGTPDLRGCQAPGNGYKDITGDGIREILNSFDALVDLMAHLPERFYMKVEGWKDYREKRHHLDIPNAPNA